MNNIRHLADRPTNRSFLRSLLAGFLALFAATAAEAKWMVSIPEDPSSPNPTATDGAWTLQLYGTYDKNKKVYNYVQTFNGQKGYQITKAVSGSGVLDLTTFNDDTGLNLLSIAGGVFEKSTAITSLIAPSVIHFGAWTFYQCASIQSITVSPDFYEFGERTFFTTPALVSLSPTTFPQVTKILKYTFQKTALKGDFDFPNVTTMGGTVFDNATNITSLSFGSLQNATEGAIFNCMTSLTNFYAPKAVNFSGASLLSGCKNLQSVTFSSDLEKMGSLSGCTALRSITPTTFPKLVSFGGVNNDANLAVDFVLPELPSLGSREFTGSGVTSVYAPNMTNIVSYGFTGCANLTNLTVLGSTHPIGWGVENNQVKQAQAISGVPTDFVLDWLSEDVPDTMVDNAIAPGNNKYPCIFKVRITEANRAKWEAFCTTLTANFTDNHRMIPNYGQVEKKVIGLCGSPYVEKGTFKSVSAGTYGTFWLVDGTEIPTYDVTIICPDGVTVSHVTAGGFEVEANADGTYTVETTAKMVITYRTAAGKLFTDGTQEVAVENVTPAETLPASTCPKTAVDALARIGETLYLTLQDAANVGGEVVALTNQTLAASVAVASDKTVVLDLNGKTISSEVAAFSVAGTLKVKGEGLLNAATPFAGGGSVVLFGGTYLTDVSAYCSAGYLATAQGTTPETWVVAPNANLKTLTLDISTFEEEHLASVELATDAPVVCTTNGTVVSWKIAAGVPFELVYTAAGNWRFNRSRTSSVAYKNGIASDTAASLDDVPARESHPKWSWDSVNGTCTDGNWVFACSKGNALTTVAGVKGIYLTGRTAGCGDLDLVTFKDDVGAGVDVIQIGGSVLSWTAYVTNVIAPAVLKLDASAFRKATGLKSIEVSPDIVYIGDRQFLDASNLETFTPTRMPQLEYVGDNVGPSTFYTKSNKLTGDFYLGKVTRISSDCFNGTGITSIEAPLATNVNGSAFSGCTALTNATLPCAYAFGASAFSGCTAMQTISFDSEHVEILEGSVFSGCKATNFPTSYPALTNLGYCAFSGAGLSGDVSMPLIPIIDRAFAKCTALTSLYAPSCVQYGDYAFSECASLTNLVVKGSKGCFNYIGKNNSQNAIQSCWALRDITWLGTEAPTNFTSSCFSPGGNGDATTKLPVLHICPAKDPEVWKAQRAAWENLCTYTKGELTENHKKIANYDEVKGTHLIGYLGGNVNIDSKTGKITAIYDSNGCRCWVVRNDYPFGLTVIVR